MSNAQQIISQAIAYGVLLSVNGDKLKMKARHKPPDDFLKAVSHNKGEIISAIDQQTITISSLNNYGLELIPCDVKYLMNRLPIGDGRQELLKRYIEYWLQGMIEESVEHKKQNAGRRKANLMILVNTDEPS